MHKAVLGHDTNVWPAVVAALGSRGLPAAHRSAMKV
jgi:hypothetical protein